MSRELFRTIAHSSAAVHVVRGADRAGGGGADDDDPTASGSLSKTCRQRWVRNARFAECTQRKHPVWSALRMRGDAREGIRGTSAAAAADPGTSPDCPRRRGRVSVAGRLPAMHPPPPLAGKLNGPSNAAPPLLRRQWQYFWNPHIHAALHNTRMLNGPGPGDALYKHKNTASFIQG